MTACACAQLYHEMKVLRLQPSTDTLNSLIVACGKAGQLDRAFEAFQAAGQFPGTSKLP